MIDIRQTEEYADYLRRGGWIVERIEGVNYFLRKFPIIGHILKIQRPDKIDFGLINKLCRKYGVFQVIIEPKDDADFQKLSLNGFKLSKKPYLPSKTLQIDLTQPKETILRGFKKHTRQAIRKSFGSEYGGERVIESNHNDALNRGHKIFIHQYSTPNEIKKFREAWKNSVNFSRYVPSEQQLLNLRKSFPQSKSLFLASHNISGSIIGGALFTISSHDRSNYIIYYWYGFTNKEGRSTLSQYSLLYQGILWGKKIGCKIFDFEGIYDDRFPHKSWLGFSQFKRSFGGYEVLYPGCYTRFRFPW